MKTLQIFILTMLAAVYTSLGIFTAFWLYDYIIGGLLIVAGVYCWIKSIKMIIKEYESTI